MSLAYPKVDTLSELLQEKAPTSVHEICDVVRDWLIVRSVLAFELGGMEASQVLDKAAVAAVR